MFDDSAIEGDTLFPLEGMTVQLYDITLPNASPFIGSFDPSLARLHSGAIRTFQHRLVVNGSLRTTDFELIDGAVLDHSPESMTEIDQ